MQQTTERGLSFPAQQPQLSTIDRQHITGAPEPPTRLLGNAGNIVLCVGNGFLAPLEESGHLDLLAKKSLETPPLLGLHSW